MLGAWIGNEIEHATSWEPILEKIESNLKRWNMCHPSLDGKHLITQMNMGGMTQFITKAQGMPKSIEAAITKKIRTFIWNDCKSPPISLTRLERPVAEGGLGLLNICTRNEAIDITWVQAFMNLSESRLSWAFVTDILINSLKPCNNKGHSNFNTLLTSWEPPTQGPRANQLPKIISNLLKTARKHNVSFAPIKLSEELKNQLPTWYHLGTPPGTYHKTKDKCLQNIHKAKTVRDLHEIARQLTSNNTHENTAKCACHACIENRLAGCKNPNKCAQTTKQITDNLSPTFNSNTSPKKDNLTLTHRRMEKNAHMRKQ
jgi:hypothetical protein